MWELRKYTSWLHIIKRKLELTIIIIEENILFLYFALSSQLNITNVVHTLKVILYIENQKMSTVRNVNRVSPWTLIIDSQLNWHTTQRQYVLGGNHDFFSSNYVLIPSLSWLVFIPTYFSISVIKWLLDVSFFCTEQLKCKKRLVSKHKNCSKVIC